MDSEAPFVAARSRWTRYRGSSTWEGSSASPGPHQQGTLTAMSGHPNTKSDQYVAVLGVKFSPDAAPPSANMITYLGPSQNLLTCRLTKAVWWYRPSSGEGRPDCQSLFGRLDWSEEIANPSPLGSQSDSRAKWVGKTGFHQSSGATAFVEWSSAVHNKTSEIGVGDAPTDRSDLGRLNPPNDLSPAMTLSGMGRFIDSDRSPAFSLLVSHPCSYTRGRSVGAFSSVRRAGRLRIANSHARTHRRDVVSRPVWTAQQGLPLGSKQGTLMGSWYQPGTHGVPRHRRRGEAALTRRACGERPADPRAGHVRSTRCCGSPRRGIATRPVWTAPTGTSLRSPLAANRSLRVPGNTEGSPGSSGEGVVILRPWPVGNPTPASVSIH
jgi:hypothetical protein